MVQIFSPNVDRVVRVLPIVIGLVLPAVVGMVWYYVTPKYTRVGYAPNQPVGYSHRLHAGQLGMSCLYCHTNVDRSPYANVPATQTCMNCHARIKPDSPLLAEVRESWTSGESIRWQQVHKLPEYAYFNHAIHVQRGVSCVSCHGQINEMEVVYHDQPLSMSWCLDCHRNPAPHLRPVEEVANLDWQPPEGMSDLEIGENLQQQLGIAPSESCQACHR